MTVDTDDARCRRTRTRPRRARRAGAAAEIEQRPDIRPRLWQPFDDMRQNEIVERAVEERESRTLTGARQGGAFGQLLPPLDVGRRQRPQGTGHFGKCQLREVLRFECSDPMSEAIVGWAHEYEAEPSPTS